MEFAYSDKVAALQDKLRDFMDRHIYPNEARHAHEIETGDRWQPTALMEELKKKAQAGRAVEPLPAAFAARRGPQQPRIRAAVRDHGPRADGVGGVQLLRARHRQHGDAGALRQRGAEGAVAEAAAGGRDPLLLRHDRARGRLVRRHQHREHHPARRRSLRDQRPQMVDHRRVRPALQDRDLHGQDRSRQSRPPSPAIDGAGADGRARREGAAAAVGVRLRRRPARPCRGAVRQCPRAAREHPAGRRPRLRDRPGPAGPGPHPPLHAARSAWPSGRSRTCASA